MLLCVLALDLEGIWTKPLADSTIRETEHTQPIHPPNQVQAHTIALDLDTRTPTIALLAKGTQS